MRRANNPVRAVESTLDILEVLKEREVATITELTKEVDLTRGTIHNHLSTLQERGFVVRTDEGYAIGLRFVEFGEFIKTKQVLYDIGVPEVESLAAETDELGNLLVEENGRGIYLHRAYGEKALQLDTGVGSRVYLHATGLGKAILAYTPDARVDEIVDRHGLPAFTEQTITDRDALYDELERIRERGYAIDRCERADEVVCVAAPIRTTDGETLGAVSIAGPQSRMKGTRVEEEIPELVTSAANVMGINATYA